MELEWSYQALSEIAAQNREYIPLVLGILCDLPLSETLQKVVCETAVQSLPIVDENDVPTLVRTLLRLMSRPNAENIVQKIRTYGTQVGDAVRVILIEVFATAFRVNALAVKTVTKVLKKTRQCTSFDVLLMMILLQRNFERKVSQCNVNKIECIGNDSWYYVCWIHFHSCCATIF